MSDRYVFAKLDGTGWYASDVTAVPAPSPEDWQAIVAAVRDFDHYRDGIHLDRIGRLCIAAVRNMREAEGPVCAECNDERNVNDLATGFLAPCPRCGEAEG